MSWHRTPLARQATWIGGCALAAALAATAGLAAGGTATTTFGELVITYDAEVWQPAGLAITALKCISPACTKASSYSTSPTLYLTAIPTRAGGKPSCDLDVADGALSKGFGREIRMHHPVGELTFAVTVTPSTCRAASPPLIEACTVSGSTAYVFASGFSNGCRTETDLPVTALTDLLNGVKPAATPR